MSTETTRPSEPVAQQERMSDHEAYMPFVGAVYRCTNPKCAAYPNYGGRGITVHAAWLLPGGFWAFAKEIGPKKPPHVILDRTNNDGNYEPGNVRWVTRQESAINRRTTRLITIDGETRNLAAWCGHRGLNISTVHARLRNGWSVEDALMFPLDFDHPSVFKANRSRISLLEETLRAHGIAIPGNTLGGPTTPTGFRI